MSPQMLMIEVLLAILEILTEAGDRGVPNGHLYVTLQGAFGADRWNIEVHERAIALLVSTGKVTNNGHLLKVRR